MLGTVSIATASPRKLSSYPCNLSAQEAAGLNGDASTDIHALAEYQITIRRLLVKQRFKTLDCLADQARSGKERFPGGIWKIHSIYWALSKPVQFPQHATQEDWKPFLKNLQRWVSQRPRSITARVALASAYLGYAWDARGNGFADAVSGNGWNDFTLRTAKAKRILDQAARLRAKCPEWYLAMQEVATNQGWSKEKARALYDEAVKFEPGYFYYARNLANYLLPKWGGNEGDTERFTQEAADRIGGDDGDILYFQVATHVLCPCDDSPHLSQPRIQKGFEAAEKKYGVSVLNLNLFASVARNGGDPIFIAKIMERIGDQWDQETWQTYEDFQTAKKWAAAMAPYVAQRRAMEGPAEENGKTPEGAQYREVFKTKYIELAQECMKDAGRDVAPFETLTKVGEKGTIEDIKVYWMGPSAVCIYNKLHTLQEQKAMPFPLPPHDAYWVRLDLAGADFISTAASK